MKRIPELRDLSDDHHSGLVLAQRCKKAGHSDSEVPEPVWERVLEAFTSHLDPHFEIEELNFLPALEAIGEVGLASRIRDEHDALRELRRSVTINRTLLMRFGQLLESHIRFEEREVFESTQSRLLAADLRTIEEACRTVSGDRSIT